MNSSHRFSTNGTGPFRFMDLPLELRRLVYSYVVTNEGPLYINLHNFFISSLQRVSLQICNEVHEEWLRHKPVEILTSRPWSKGPPSIIIDAVLDAIANLPVPHGPIMTPQALAKLTWTHCFEYTSDERELQVSISVNRRSATYHVYAQVAPLCTDVFDYSIEDSDVWERILVAIPRMVPVLKDVLGKPLNDGYLVLGCPTPECRGHLVVMNENGLDVGDFAACWEGWRGATTADEALVQMSHEAQVRRARANKVSHIDPDNRTAAEEKAEYEEECAKTLARLKMEHEEARKPGWADGREVVIDQDPDVVLLLSGYPLCIEK